jgi:hypothetical protein
VEKFARDENQTPEYSFFFPFPGNMPIVLKELKDFEGSLRAKLVEIEEWEKHLENIGGNPNE